VIAPAIAAFDYSKGGCRIAGSWSCASRSRPRLSRFPLCTVRHLNDDELRAGWTERFTTLAAEGDEAKRIKSLVSALRALPQIDPDERRRLTRGRMHECCERGGERPQIHC
jgi:hypothetical protein